MCFKEGTDSETFPTSLSFPLYPSFSCFSTVQNSSSRPVADKHLDITLSESVQLKTLKTNPKAACKALQDVSFRLLFLAYNTAILPRITVGKTDFSHSFKTIKPYWV